jgi:hypothetical protein
LFALNIAVTNFYTTKIPTFSEINPDTIIYKTTRSKLTAHSLQELLGSIRREVAATSQELRLMSETSSVVAMAV